MPNRTIGRVNVRESQIPEWQEMLKTKTVDKMVLEGKQLSFWLATWGRNLNRQPACPIQPSEINLDFGGHGDLYA